MAGHGNNRGGAPEHGKMPGLTEAEKKRRRDERYERRKRNKADHAKRRDLSIVARGIAKEVPAFARATEVLAEIEDINEHLSSYMNAGVAVLGEAFPELVSQEVERALDRYGEDGELVKAGDPKARQFLIQKMIDLKPLVEGGSFQNQQMMSKMQALLEEEGTAVVATERKIEVRRD